MARKKPKASEGVTVTDSTQAPGGAPAETANDALPDALSLPSGLPFPIVGVGASAGGLDAFTQVLEGLPPDADLALIFVQHLLADRKSELAQVLASRAPWPVVEATHGRAIEPRHVYVIPANATLEVTDGHIRLTPRAPDHGHHHLPVDHLFRSLAQTAQEKAIGVVLSGTGSDGSTGVREIRAVGGIAIAQLPDTAQYDGMPRAAIATDGVDLILPPAKIGPELARIAEQAQPPRHVRPGCEGDALSVEEDDLRRVFMLLRGASGVDFKHYKLPTIRRRLRRRMTLQKAAEISDYIRLMEENPAEVQALYRDMLIHVTRFFREPESFETLKQVVFPKIMQARKEDEPIRIWVPGCSTGEEAYSVSMALLEFLGERPSGVPIQVFATDLSESAVDRARGGMYPEAITEDISPAQLRRFFSRTDGSFQIAKSVRDLCIFARQDLTRDPPFSRLDLIVCRNVLIYLNPMVQKRLMGIFHYALKPAGFLVLGVAETVGPHSDLFGVADKKHRVYTKMTASYAPAIMFSGEYRGGQTKHRHSDGDTHVSSKIQEAKGILMERFAPPGVVVDHQLQIIYFQGQTGDYLEPASGDASLHILKMARHGLVYGLRTAIGDARKTGRAARREGLAIRRSGRDVEVDVEVIPLGPVNEERHLLVLFSDDKGVAEPEAKPPSAKSQSAKSQSAKSQSAKSQSAKSQSAKSQSAKKAKTVSEKEVEARIDVLQQELAASREYLQSIIQDLEAANEELQSTNEEILSSNEELQSTNEELDTAKEELQSINEELNTVNEELHTRNQELNRINSDLVNLLASVQIAIVMVSSDMRIRRFTPMAEKMLNLIPSDIGRPIGQIKPSFPCTDLEQLILESTESMIPVAREVQDQSGRWFSLTVRPYRTLDNRIDGAIVGLFDVDVQKAGSAALRGR